MLYLDLETTGLHAPLDEIVEIAIIDDNGAVLLNTRVRPVRQTEWPEAQRIHGISPRDVAWAPTLAQLSTRIQGLYMDGKW
jgi:DNA polymerase-3 subunit epsilon